MNTNFVTKRPHKKSRAGCKTCKARKVKCDEAQPSCTFCATRKIQCIYSPRLARSAHGSSLISHGMITPAGSASPVSEGKFDTFMSFDLTNPLPPVTTSSGNLSADDLRLMFHWSTFTFNSIGVGDQMHNVLRFVLPELAFQNDFLLNGMLGVASLHRQRLLPDAGNSQKQTEIYRFKALNLFRKAISTAGPGSSNYEALAVMSILLIVLCSQDYDPVDGELTIIRFIALYRGLQALFSVTSYERVSSSSVGPVFKRQLTELTVDPVVPTVLLNMLAAVHPLDSEYEDLPYYCNILDALGLLYGGLRQDGLGTKLEIRVISWPSFVSDQFAKFSKENRPRALVILSYYLVFLKLIKGLWWIEGIPDREIKAIRHIVGPEYAIYMEVPLQAVEMSDLGEIGKLMLR